MWVGHSFGILSGTSNFNGEDGVAALTGSASVPKADPCAVQIGKGKSNFIAFFVQVFCFLGPCSLWH